MEYIDEMTSRSFFYLASSLPFIKGRGKSVIVHDLMHDLARYIANGQCHVGMEDTELMIFSSEIRHASLVISNSRAKLSSFQGTTGLHTLLVSDDTLFGKVELLRHFKDRDLSETGMQEMLDSLGHMIFLRYLMRRVQNIKLFPKVICTLYNLQELDLSHSQIEELPGSICYLKHLSHFDIGHSMIKELPETVSMLKNLQLLSLRYTQIKKLPSSFGNLESLLYLDLQGTKINLFPASICMLYNLQLLDLGDTPIKEFPSSIDNLKHLNSLYLQGTGIQKLPESICSIYDLRTLDLRNCQELQELPVGIGRLIRLQDLKYFPVGRNRESDGIVELKDLIYLRGTLSITSLCNVVNAEEAKAANLVSKINLEKLEFNWEVKLDAPVVQEEEEKKVAELEEEVLQSLQPHANVKELEISSYLGFKFPEWVGHASFINLVTFKFYNCRMCTALPYFGRLPSLQLLHIEWMPSLTQDLTIEWMPSKKKLQESRTLLIRDCPNLILLQTSVVDKLEIDGCENLVSVDLQDTSMIHLKISDCPRLHFPPKTHLPSKIETFEVYRCPLLIMWCRRYRAVKLAGVNNIILEGELQQRKRFSDCERPDGKGKEDMSETVPNESEREDKDKEMVVLNEDSEEVESAPSESQEDICIKSCGVLEEQCEKG